GSGSEEAHGMAVTPDGLVVVGMHDGPIEGPGGIAESRGMEDAFVARLSRDGQLTWLRTLGSPKPDFAWSVAALGGGGGAIVGIESDGTLQIDGVSTRTAEQERRDDQPPVLLALDAGGKRTWEKSLAGENGAVRAVAARGSDVAVAGWSLVRSGPRDLGTGPMTCDLAGMFVGVWSAAGEARWVRCSKARLASQGQRPDDVAFGADGRVAMCGRMDAGMVGFGGSSVEVEHDQGAVVVAAFGPGGEPLWIATPAVDLDAECLGLVVADDGTVIVAVNTGVAPAVGEVIALADGKPTWRTPVSRLLGRDRGTATAIASSGRDLLVGAYSKDGGALVAVDPRSGAARGAPTALGVLHAEAIAVGDQIYVAGDADRDGSVAGHAVKVRGKKDVVVVALPANAAR
ncbi:MAG TPA: hypothetical protein VGD80_28660, partial [Kofleriaceae bacterium]